MLKFHAIKLKNWEPFNEVHAWAPYNDALFKDYQNKIEIKY